MFSASAEKKSVVVSYVFHQRAFVTNEIKVKERPPIPKNTLPPSRYEPMRMLPIPRAELKFEATRKWENEFRRLACFLNCVILEIVQSDIKLKTFAQVTIKITNKSCPRRLKTFASEMSTINTS